jgi:hypothetical protein
MIKTATKFRPSGIYYHIKVILREVVFAESGVSSSNKIGIIKIVKHYLDVNVNSVIFDILELLVQKTNIVKKKKKHKVAVFSHKIDLHNPLESISPKLSALNFFVKFLKSRLSLESNIRHKLTEELEHVIRLDKHELYKNIYEYDFNLSRNIRPFKYFI